MDEMGDKVATTSHRQQAGGRRGSLAGSWAHKRAAHLTAQAECTQTPRSQGNKAGYMAAVAATATGVYGYDDDH